MSRSIDRRTFLLASIAGLLYVYKNVLDNEGAGTGSPERRPVAGGVEGVAVTPVFVPQLVTALAGEHDVVPDGQVEAAGTAEAEPFEVVVSEVGYLGVNWNTVDVEVEDWWVNMELARPIPQGAFETTRMDVPPEWQGKTLSREVLSRAGFDDLQAERLRAAFPAFLAAQEKTGLDWRVFASVLWLEHAGSMTNANADGPYQITRPWFRKYPPTELVRRGIVYKKGADYYFNANRQNSFEDFVAISVHAAEVIRAHARSAAAVAKKRGQTCDLNSGRLEDQAWFAAIYNGLPSARTVHGMLIYGDPWHHPYVMNRFKGVVNGQSWNYGQMYASDGRGGYVLLQKEGYLAYFQKCTKAWQLANGG